MAKRIGAVGLGGYSAFLKVDHFHAPGETLHAQGLYTEFGGKAYNQAVAARRLGAEVTFFGAVGDDENGALCRADLEREGIRPCLQVCPGQGTAYACILTDAQGENRVTVYGGAAGHLSAEFIRSQEAEIAACDYLLLGLECPEEATLAALELAKKHGVFTILNPAPAKPMDSSLLRQFDLLTPNAQEAAVLLNIPHPATAAQLVCALDGQAFPDTIVTLGSQGALLWEKGEAFLFDPLKVTAVDTTGAGDCLNGALAAALARGMEVKEALALAVKASALSVTKSYVMPSLPVQADLDRVPDVTWQEMKV